MPWNLSICPIWVCPWECKSPKSLNVFWPLEFLWNCPDLHLHNTMVVCLFAHYKLAHGTNNGPMRNCYKFKPLGPVMIYEVRGSVGLRMHFDKQFQNRSNCFSQNCERKVAWIWIYVVDYVLTGNINMKGTWKVNMWTVKQTMVTLRVEYSKRVGHSFPDSSRKKHTHSLFYSPRTPSAIGKSSRVFALPIFRVSDWTEYFNWCFCVIFVTLTM